MARNNLRKTQGHRFYLSLGDGESPEVFKRIAILNTNIAPNWSYNVSEESVPDLENFDNPYDIVREIMSKDFTVEGQGKVDARYLGEIIELFEGERQGQAVNARFTMEGEHGFTLTGPFVLSNFSIDGPYKEVATCSMTWQKADELIYAKNVTP